MSPEMATDLGGNARNRHASRLASDCERVTRDDGNGAP
jgi:hypothetical protein